MVSRYEHFSYLISTVFRCIQKIEREEMVQYGYRGAYAQYLAALFSHPEGLTSAELSEFTGKDKAAVSRIVAEMEEKGLIRRHGRETLYRARLLLTESGKDAAQYVTERAQAAVDAGGKTLSEEDRQIFYAALDLIAHNLESIAQKGIDPQ